MGPIAYVLLSLTGIAVAFCLFMLVRNEWVYRSRIGLLWADYEAYKRLPSYGAMMSRFWVWDARAFLETK